MVLSVKKIFLLLWGWGAPEALRLEQLLQEKTLEETLGNKRIGYYIASFPPLHLGHQDIQYKMYRANPASTE